MDRPATSPAARSEFDRVAAGLTGSGATLGRMMGMPMLYWAGKGFAGLWGDAMTFRLDEADLAGALAMPGARLFDPSGASRPMKAWVEVPAADPSAWESLARRALAAAVARAS